MLNSKLIVDDSASDLLRSVLDCLSVPAVLIGSDHKILATNRTYCSRYCREQSVIGRACYEVSHDFGAPCGEAGEYCPVKATQANGDPHRTVHVHQSLDGPCLLDVSVRPIADAEGKVSMFLETLDEIKGVSAVAEGEGLVGRSPAISAMLELVARVAPSRTTVLLRGESGTGRELVARTIHQGSDRADGPFVPVDCSGITDALFESELFGHHQDAPTGATAHRMGLVELAHSGTLALNEVGDLPVGQQVKVLRLLETEAFRRVGGTELVPTDFRLVCTTRGDLEELVQDGAFHHELYLRLSSFPITVPPLRERVGDLPLLVEHFRHRLGLCHRYEIHPDTMALLEGYAFPGNVRELLNLLERAQLLADGDTLLPRHFPEVCRHEPSSPPPIPADEIQSLAAVESQYLHWASARHPGDNRELARKLGGSERTLYRKLQRIRPDH